MWNIRKTLHFSVRKIQHRVGDMLLSANGPPEPVAPLLDYIVGQKLHVYNVKTDLALSEQIKEIQNLFIILISQTSLGAENVSCGKGLSEMSSLLLT